MKKICFTVENDGFYGTYYECPQQSDYVMIGLFGDDPNDYMAKCGASVLMRFFPDLVRCMPVAENSPRTLIRWAEKELLNLLTGDTGTT